MGMTQIGECRSCAHCLHPLTRCLGTFVQFLETVMSTPNMRVVPLTPVLPFATIIDVEGSWQRFLLAFKVASTIPAKIQADISKFVQEPPPEVPWHCVGSQVSQESKRTSCRHPHRYTSSSRFYVDTTQNSIIGTSTTLSSP